MQTGKGKCGVSHSLGSELTHCGARLTSEAGVRGAQERGSHSQCSSRGVQAALKQEIRNSFILSNLLTLTAGEQVLQRSAAIPQSKGVISGKLQRQSWKQKPGSAEGTATRRRGRGMHDVSARGRRSKGKAAFRLGKPHPHSGNSEQAPQAPLGSEHHSPAVELQEQKFKRSASLQSSTTLGKEGCSHSWE